MKEIEANNFDLPSIDNETTPISVRTLIKNPGTHISEVPDNECSIHISSSWNISTDEWKSLALACEHAGFNTSVSDKSIAVW